jgi:hypothetical protein
MPSFCLALSAMLFYNQSTSYWIWICLICLETKKWAAQYARARRAVARFWAQRAASRRAESAEYRACWQNARNIYPKVFISGWKLPLPREVVFFPAWELFSQRYSNTSRRVNFSAIPTILTIVNSRSSRSSGSLRSLLQRTQICSRCSTAYAAAILDSMLESILENAVSRSILENADETAFENAVETASRDCFSRLLSIMLSRLHLETASRDCFSRLLSRMLSR